MNQETEKTLAFFGKMTANLTHEVKNILAIIQESAGLMEDIMAISPLAAEKYQERFNNSLATIKTQLQRGMELTTRFNRFAHTPDRTSEELNLGESLEQFCALTERFARLQHISLETSNIAGDRINIKTNPVLLFMALFYSLESCLGVLPANSAIRLTANKKDGKPSVEVACTGKEAPGAEEFFQKIKETQSWPEFRDVAARLEAGVECDANDLRFRLVL